MLKRATSDGRPFCVVINAVLNLRLPLWLGQHWLERGGRVFEPKGGLKSRALTKSETHRLSQMTPLSQCWPARR